MLDEMSLQSKIKIGGSETKSSQKQLNDYINLELKTCKFKRASHEDSRLKKSYVKYSLGLHM